jgi:uncharacterized protein (TIGR03435 family)
MLQAMLAERFHLKIRLDNKEQNIYALVQGKDGHKMKPAVEDTPTPAAAPERAPKADVAMTVNGEQMSVNRTADGAVVKTADTGEVKVTAGAGGTIRMAMSRITMPKLVEQLTPMLDRPVVDMTGLTGPYQVALEISMQDLASVARAAGMALPGAAAGGNGQAADPGGSIMTSVQQLGLKLDGRKAPVEMVVVESVDRNPTEN